MVLWDSFLLLGRDGGVSAGRQVISGHYFIEGVIHDRRIGTRAPCDKRRSWGEVLVRFV